MVSYIDLGREGLEFGVLYICGHHVDQWTLPYQDCGDLLSDCLG